jgi:hypothetical protein
MFLWKRELTFNKVHGVEISSIPPLLEPQILHSSLSVVSCRHVIAKFLLASLPG